MKQIVHVENMSCQNCVKHVTNHFLSSKMGESYSPIYKVINVNSYVLSYFFTKYVR